MFLKILSILVALSGLFMYYNNYTFNFFPSTKVTQKSTTEKLYTENELSKYNGVDSDFLYLSLLGRIFDVTKGSKHYGPGSNYNIFIGRDASKSFITGEFSDTSKTLDDVLELAPNDLIGLENWIKMYDEQYIYKGKLIGRFYDADGMETDYMMRVKEKLEDAQREKLLKEKLNTQYPPCNAEWDANTGSRVWCTKRSGGVDRDWEGVPRMIHEPGASEPHCVCVREDLINSAKLKEYEGCDPIAPSCVVKRD
ncbi:neuferricin homolog [Arctopsyche grandis]|uniref:neuferricin homolog n=1 Tax=Arctopsyche grandis TaxID=121162 RepID=UPI00406D6B08